MKIICVKHCPLCSETKDVNLFWTESCSKDGYSSACSDCISAGITKTQKEADTRKRYSFLKGNAKARGLEMNITFEQYEELIRDRTCYYTGLDFSHQGGSNLNRIDNSKGYLIDNVKPCEGDFNKLMSNFSHEYLASVLLPHIVLKLKDSVKK